MHSQAALEVGEQSQTLHASSMGPAMGSILPVLYALGLQPVQCRQEMLLFLGSLPEAMHNLW